ncbi:unnamed protein product [Heterobilharzia americana]|nr:unnamed protein product [Heterobilharzia americana]
MPRNMNMNMNNRRITVQQLKNYIDSQSSYLLIDIRPKTEFDICHLKSSLHIPFNELFRESVISDIREAIDNGISNKGATLPFPVILLCHRGNRSAEAAPKLGSALMSFRCSNPDNRKELVCADGDDSNSDFVVCDVAGGLSAWSSEIDPNFPTY